MQLHQRVKGAEATVAMKWDPAESFLLQAPSRTHWAHRVLLMSPKVPVSYGREHCSCRQAQVTPASLCLGIPGTQHLGQPPKVEGVMRQHQPPEGKELKHPLTWAGQLTAPRFGLVTCCCHCFGFPLEVAHSWATSSRFYLLHEIIPNSLHIPGPA